MAYEDRKDSTKNKRKNPPQKLEKNALEWTVFALSAVLVLLIIGYLSFQSFNSNGSTPDISVRAVKEPSKNNPHRYRIIVTNHGSATAEEVNVVAEVYKADSVMETAELQLAFSPKLSDQEGWVNFDQDPALADSMRVRVLSYKKP